MGENQLIESEMENLKEGDIICYRGRMYAILLEGGVHRTGGPEDELYMKVFCLSGQTKDGWYCHHGVNFDKIC